MQTSTELLLLIATIACLFAFPKRLMTITAASALGMIALTGGTSLAATAPHLVTVLLVMSATQLALRHVLEAGLEARLSSAVASIATHRWFRKLPAAVILPAVFIPATWILAAIIHNVPAIAVLTPLFCRMATSFNVTSANTLCAMLIASNLGGASTAFGDGPAIMQREVWGFDPGTFAAAMFPRNVILVVSLMIVTVLTTWWPVRGVRPDWTEAYRRLKLRARIARNAEFNGNGERGRAIAAAVILLGFITAQFIFPTRGLQIAAISLLALILITPEEERGDAMMVLGLEPIVVISGLMVIASAVQTTPEFTAFAGLVGGKIPGIVESVAYVLTFAISADGAAAALVHLVHASEHGSLLSAWKLASGICAGSSALLTSASAGPILYALAKLYGHEISFRRYALFGVPFSLFMLVVYIGLNVLWGGR